MVISAAIDAVIEELRNEPFQMFGNNCLRKSLRFRRECHKTGINARVVLALVLAPCKRRFYPPCVVWFHAWAEVDGRRIELARPLDERNTAGAFDSDIKPLIGIWI